MDNGNDELCKICRPTACCHVATNDDGGPCRHQGWKILCVAIGGTDALARCAVSLFYYGVVVCQCYFSYSVNNVSTR